MSESTRSGQDGVVERRAGDLDAAAFGELFQRGTTRAAILRARSKSCVFSLSPKPRSFFTSSATSGSSRRAGEAHPAEGEMHFQVEQLLVGEQLLLALEIDLAQVCAALREQLGVARDRLHPQVPVDRERLLDDVPALLGVEHIDGLASDVLVLVGALARGVGIELQQRGTAPSSPRRALSRASPAPRPCRYRRGSRAAGPKAEEVGPRRDRGIQADADARGKRRASLSITISKPSGTGPGSYPFTGTGTCTVTLHGSRA